MPEYCAVFSLFWHPTGSVYVLDCCWLETTKNTSTCGKYRATEIGWNSYSVAEILRCFLFVINGNLILYCDCNVMTYTPLTDVTKYSEGCDVYLHKMNWTSCV